jgi:hypothetical protein
MALEKQFSYTMLPLAQAPLATVTTPEPMSAKTSKVPSLALLVPVTSLTQYGNAWVAMDVVLLLVVVLLDVQVVAIAVVVVVV